MLLRRSFAALVLGLAVIAPVFAADTYKVDPVHSTCAFRIKHANVSYFYGRFNAPEGTVMIDDSDPTKTVFDVSIKTASVDTANSKRDDHLKGPDFFNAKEFPTISFKSKEVKSVGENKMEVSGDLTLHGQTKPITVMIERVGTIDNAQLGGHRTGYEASMKIKRSDFGMTKYLEMLGDEVDLRIGLEALKQ
jgi:polyisoprenoid-binding protein YceI